MTCLDLGCSTGNFLGHLRGRFPDLNLVGGDLAESSLEVCRSREDLKDVEISRIDITDIGRESSFDVITVNVVLYLMDTEKLGRAIKSIHEALKPGGLLAISNAL